MQQIIKGGQTFEGRAYLIELRSDMEFSHEVFRIMVLEQLYRASCVINNHPYQQIEE